MLMRQLQQSPDDRLLKKMTGGHMLGNTEEEGDLGMIGQDRKLLFTLQDSDFAWLKCVSEAVERIDNGNYGECLSCGQDIDEETLDAVPWVAFCLRCAK